LVRAIPGLPLVFSGKPSPEQLQDTDFHWISPRTAPAPGRGRRPEAGRGGVTEGITPGKINLGIVARKGHFCTT
jgi:hypothetical protein